MLNRTSVPAQKNTPSEIGLQQTLSKLTKLDLVLFWFKQAIDSFPNTVYLKYPMDIYKERYVNNTGPVNSIIQASNKRKATGLKWREYERTRFNQAKLRSLKTGCNGVNIELSSWRVSKSAWLNFSPKVGENTVIQTVAGVQMPTLTESELTKIFNQEPFVREKYPIISALKHDPIPLLWSKKDL